jgi:hypothetical protein
MPEFIKPQLATLKSKAPARPQWLHEIKFDGYRIQVYLNNGKRKVFTRDGLDGTKRFSQIAGTLDIRGQAIIDGEAVVIHDGRKVVEPVLAPSRKRFCFANSRRCAPSTARSKPARHGHRMRFNPGPWMQCCPMPRLRRKI